MSDDEENDRFENEQRLLSQNFNKISCTPSAWEQDENDVDEDPNPHGKYDNFNCYYTENLSV